MALGGSGPLGGTHGSSHGNTIWHVGGAVRFFFVSKKNGCGRYYIKVQAPYESL